MLLRPPQVSAITFIPSIRQIYSVEFWIAIGLRFVLQTRPLHLALYLVLVHRTGTLPWASFRFHLTMDSLAFDKYRFLGKIPLDKMVNLATREAKPIILYEE